MRMLNGWMLCLVLCLAGGAAARGAQLPSLDWEPRSDWVSVTDFGAVGDGRADDTASLQKALDTVVDGSTVYLPPGTYRINAPKSAPSGKKPDFKKKDFKQENPAKPFKSKSISADGAHKKEEQPFKKDNAAKPFKSKPFPAKDTAEEKLPFKKDRPATFQPKEKQDRPSAPDKKEASNFQSKEKKPFRNERDKPVATNDPGLPFKRKELKKQEQKPQGAPKSSIKVKSAEAEEGLMPLNKYISHGGICSRRDAGELVKAGKVKVNGETMTNPAYKVQEKDEVVANGKKVLPKVNLVYILLNKPKDFITTAEDPQGRKTVLDIVKHATTERIYPVGRLDRNTSGVLLLTNDGELAQHLTHPSFQVRKIYEAKLDRPLIKADFDKLLDGITLEDGLVQADSVAYADSKDKSVIGIEIHSGRNRVVRRMFEHLGYDVKGLDRVMFANLTKKNVDRGKWRFLTDKEVRLLKFFNKSKR
jgi:23S rRNA pseudouridine2605 synthase